MYYAEETASLNNYERLGALLNTSA